MAALSAAQIYGYARGAGFSASQATIATAIALAESGGNPASNCHNCLGVTEDSRGLWQINVDAHPQMAGWNLYDPATNARAAYQVSNGGQNFGPWSTYTSGAYSSHLGAANAVSGAPPITGPTQTTGGAAAGSATTATNVAWYDYLNPITGIQSLLGGIGSSIGKDVLQITVEGVLIFGGVALVVIGLYRTVQPTVQKVTAAAGAAAKVAAIA